MPSPLPRTQPVETSPAFEEVLARLYTDSAFRQQFLANPSAISGLSQAESEALSQIDRVGLDLAARSVASKKRHGRPTPSSWIDRLRNLLS